MTTHYNQHGQVDNSDTSEGGRYVYYQTADNSCLTKIVSTIVFILLVAIVAFFAMQIL